MPTPSAQFGTFLPVRVMLVDLDPIYRLGLKTCFDESAEFRVVAELGRASEILQRLETLAEEEKKVGDVRKLPLDLLVWSVDIRHAGQPMTVGIPQLVRSRYPGLPICVLLNQNDSWLLQELWQSSVEGCWLKDTNQAALLAAMRQIASAQKVWDARLLSQLFPQTRPRVLTRSSSSAAGRVVNRIRQSLGDRSLRELEQGLSELDQYLAGAGLGIWERFVLEGRFREMRMARRFVQGMVLPGGQPPGRDNLAPWPTHREEERRGATLDAVNLEVPPLDVRSSALVNVGQSAAEVISETTDRVGGGVERPLDAVNNIVVSENQFQTYKGALIESVIAKLSQSLQNLTAEPLEIDILNPTKRQELFFIVLRLIEETLDDLRYSNVTPAQLAQQRSQILRELWQRATADFFGKYVMLPVSGDAEVQIVPRLLESMTAVETSILAKIPLVEPWMEHLLFQTPLQVNSQAAVMGSPEAMRQAEALLENLMVRVANAVVAPLLNQFAAVEVVKQTFYDRRWITTREIERFRNALSWKYRMDQFFGEPKNIFESQVPVLTLSPVGIRCQELYTPRDEELQQLNGIPFLVTLALEARDAIAPPLRASFTWVGRGVVYLLTQVVGRGIGLIGRGILQGIGTAWQETREGKQATREDERRRL